MPYPPKPPRKHPELTVAEARTQHLTPYQFKAGEPQANNPRGMTKAQREQYLEAKGLLHQAGPLAIRRLVRLAGIDLERNTLLPDEELPDPRVVLIAAQNLAERVYGRPKEAAEPVAAEAEEPKSININVGFVAASRPQTLEEPREGPIIDGKAAADDVATMESAERGNAAERVPRTEALEVTQSGAWRKAESRSSEHVSKIPVQNASGFSGRR